MISLLLWKNYFSVVGYWCTKVLYWNNVKRFNYTIGTFCGSTIVWLTLKQQQVGDWKRHKKKPFRCPLQVHLRAPTDSPQTSTEHLSALERESFWVSDGTGERLPGGDEQLTPVWEGILRSFLHRFFAPPFHLFGPCVCVCVWGRVSVAAGRRFSPLKFP